MTVENKDSTWHVCKHTRQFQIVLGAIKELEEIEGNLGQSCGFTEDMLFEQNQSKEKEPCRVLEEEHSRQREQPVQKPGMGMSSSCLVTESSLAGVTGTQ